MGNKLTIRTTSEGVIEVVANDKVKLKLCGVTATHVASAILRCVALGARDLDTVREIEAGIDELDLSADLEAGEFDVQLLADGDVCIWHRNGIVFCAGIATAERLGLDLAIAARELLTI